MQQKPWLNDKGKLVKGWKKIKADFEAGLYNPPQSSESIKPKRRRWR